MNEQRNLIFAVVLSALILFGWSFVAEHFFPTATQPSTKIVDGKQVALPQPKADPAADSPAAVRELQTVVAESPRVRIETPRLEGSINLKGARIDDLMLVSHSEALNDESPSIRLLSPSGAKDAYFANFGWTGEGLPLPGPDTVWAASGDTLAPGKPVTLRWNNGQGQIFAIQISVDDGYLFDVRQTVANQGAGPVAIRPFGLVSRVGESKDKDTWTIHTGPIGVLNGKATYDIDFSTLTEDGDQTFSTNGGWIGFTDKYWLTALVPPQNAGTDAAFRAGANGSYQADVTTAPAIVAPGKAVAYESRLFAGAKEVSLLDRYEKDLGIRQFDKAIDWGWFYWFERPIYSLLHWLFEMIGNFGFAIMGLTLIVRLVMFPIAQKQFASMASMRVIQPKMKAIQERYKDDKAKQQQEILKLYQAEKVNPMAGCLPIVIQIPIFYALYKVLMLSVEMRHQPFALWIQDLSAPDPLTPVNLFGLLPFTPPSILAIGVLPILVGFTSWLQFKLNPAPTDPVQKQVFSIMPWAFVFIMAPFAAGLQLYWVTNNVLTILQQKWLYSRHPGMKATVDAG